MAEYGTMRNENRLDLSREIPLAAPLVIQLEPSGFCNLKCSFCPVNDESTQAYIKKSCMSQELFREFVRQCAAFPRPIKVLRLIGNGEPLTNPRIVDFVAHAKESGCFERVEITSNGTLLSRGMSDSLVAAGLDVLKVSLEAVDGETFRRISGVQVDISELFERLAYFYRHRKRCKLYIKTTDLALETEGQRDYFLTVYGEIADYIFVESVTDIWPGYTGKLGAKPRYDKKCEFSRPICIQPFDLLSIAADGTVLPCCADWQRKLALGNLESSNLADLWQGAELHALRIRLLEHGRADPCSACKFPAVSQSDYIDEAAEEILARLTGASCL